MKWLGRAPGVVLVPLCGKTLDLCWLAAQPGVTQVVGVELVRQAVDAFAVEHPELALKPLRRKEERRGFNSALGNGRLSLLCGDVFALPPSPAFDRIFDRASLIALEPSLRAAYVRTLTAALKPGGQVLLQTLVRREAPASATSTPGPPFSVSEADVAALYGDAYMIKKLGVNSLASTRQGVGGYKETFWLLTKKA
jgi:thiopurine S-methyltransferase